MNWTRTATLGVVGGALVAWLAGAATSNTPRAIDTAMAKPTPIELRGAALAAEIARLRERLHPGIEPQHPARNLFQFSTGAKATSSSLALPLPVSAEAPLSSTPPASPFKLIGVAEDPSADGPVRTAIISGPGGLVFVKEGDTFNGRFRLQRLSGEVAELSDLVDATTYRLALK